MKQRYSFLLTPTWLGWLAMCMVFMIACYFLGQWQLDRREHVVEENNRVVENYDEDPIPYAEARDQFHSPAEDDEWRVVSMEGEYLTEDQQLIRNRGHAGQVGYEQAVPFREAETSDVLVISRGWLATSSEDGGQPESNPDPPEGEVDVVVRLQPGEPAIDRDAPQGQLASLDLAEYEQTVGYDLVPGAYGLMDQETPDPGQAPHQLVRPSLDEGPHLSYSMQWIAFGLLGFIGWGYAARLHARNRDMEELDATAEDSMGSASAVQRQMRVREAKRLRRQKTGRYSDEDAEDAAVDEQLTRR